MDVEKTNGPPCHNAFPMVLCVRAHRVWVRQPSFRSIRSGDNSSSSAISRNSTGSSGSHQPRDLDLPAKRFTLVNPGISGYHSGSRSRD
ncbi:hypothetical protein ANTPLA_LOCUS3800 [Anthophora plagiata]